MENAKAKEETMNAVFKIGSHPPMRMIVGGKIIVGNTLRVKDTYRGAKWRVVRVDGIVTVDGKTVVLASFI